ncbi:MAG TPA: aminotransferase class V-fold PLP-dependent enzyme [Kofleriaceae bacterium]|jgi:cysteine desulfurase
MQPIYLDNAASTRVADDVLALTTEIQRTAWGNPSAQHPQGALARAHIATARDRMLAALGDKAGAGDIVWTSGCSEANALAVLGAARVRPGRLVITTFEHPATSTLADRLAAEGREVVRVAAERDGVIDPDRLAEAARDAGVVSFVAVQNEIGVVQPVAALVGAVRRAAPNAHVHVDGAQALGKIALDVAAGFDSLSIAGHKLHGPKGVGALWLRNSARIEPLWVGGGQQHGLRGGTQDAPSSAGLGLAAERAVLALSTARARWLEFASSVMAALEARGVRARQLVPDHRRSPHILAIAIAGVPASALRNVLSSRGVYVSTGSACADADHKKSHVLEAIGLPPDDGMVRLSFGLDTTREEVEAASTILADVATGLAK